VRSQAFGRIGVVHGPMGMVYSFEPAQVHVINMLVQSILAKKNPGLESKRIKAHWKVLSRAFVNAVKRCDEC
jgi:hypothetical protein